MKKQIMFICNNMKGGGAERMILNILNHLDREKYTPHLVLFEKEGIHLHHVPSHVRQLFLFRKGKLSYIKIIVQLAFRVFSGFKPDLVVSFMILPNIITLLASFLSFYKPHIVISVRNNPDMDFIIQKQRTLKKLLMRLLYKQAEHSIVISQGIKKALVTHFTLKTDKISVVYNGIDIEKVRSLAREEPDGNDPVDLFFQGKSSVCKKDCLTVSACGRLTPQKGFSYLIRGFRRIADTMNAVLFIFGEGEERDTLTKLIKSCHMEERIFLPGFKANPFQYIARSDLFILSSLYEGFANVIVEAMACGTPVIATDCPFGPGEIIQSPVNGILIPPGDTKAIADALSRVLQNQSLREQLSLAGGKRVQDFHSKKMTAGFEAVFDLLCERS